MFLRVGSGTNERSMSRFFTRIKSLHIWGNFSKFVVVEFEDFRLQTFRLQTSETYI